MITRILGNCILSVNDSWGVFSRSRITLLPHQLWVCKRVLESWPTRWLVADDVGLGKTIEAGLILTPLLSSGRVRRLLILAPASLVEQWQVRLREMFDIRVSTYAPTVDTETSDYWNTHDKIVASAHTLRLDTGGRWDRLVEAKPWDLVLVDEAHHMNVDEDGPGLCRSSSWSVFRRWARSVDGALHGHTASRQRLRVPVVAEAAAPDDFDPQEPLEAQVQKLRTVMIRNNKQRVTDMKGEPLFTPVRPQRETYSYSPEEARFYGNSRSSSPPGRPMRRSRAAAAPDGDPRPDHDAEAGVELGSRRAARARGRLARLQEAKIRSASRRRPCTNRGTARGRRSREPRRARPAGRAGRRELGGAVNLNPNEIPALEELLAAADDVVKETKIERILEVIDESFAGRSVLFFTEYKATQALLMGELQRRYGDGCVTFINGDGFIEEVKDVRGASSLHKRTGDVPPTGSIAGTSASSYPPRPPARASIFRRAAAR